MKKRTFEDKDCSRKHLRVYLIAYIVFMTKIFYLLGFEELKQKYCKFVCNVRFERNIYVTRCLDEVKLMGKQ